MNYDRVSYDMNASASTASEREHAEQRDDHVDVHGILLRETPNAEVRHRKGVIDFANQLTFGAGGATQRAQERAGDLRKPSRIVREGSPLRRPMLIALPTR
jgi:hypothetical protein